MATTKYLHVGIDGSAAVAGERVVVRSLDNIGRAATDTANTMQRSTNRIKGDLEGTGNASERSGRVVVRNLQTIKKEAELAGVSVRDLEHMFVRLAARTAQIALIYGSLSTVKNVIKETLGYLGQLETSTLGIATSFLAGGKYIDQITGKALQGSQALKAAQQNSVQVINELKAANFETIATLDQLIYAYQVTLPVALAKGFDQKQVLDFTKAMVQAAGAIGLPLDQMAEETRAMLTGQISRHSRIAQVLGLRPEDIKQFKGDAAGLFDFLMGRLDAYGEAGKESMKTWAGLWSNMTDMMKQLGGVGAQPLFEGVKAALTEIMDSIGKINPLTKEMEFNPKALQTVKDVGQWFKNLFDIVSSGTRFLVEHREAIVNLATLYASYRASLMATAIVKKALYVDTQQEIVVEQARTQTIFQANLAEKARIAGINEQLAVSARLTAVEATRAKTILDNAIATRNSVAAETELAVAKASQLAVDAQLLASQTATIEAKAASITMRKQEKVALLESIQAQQTQLAMELQNEATSAGALTRITQLKKEEGNVKRSITLLTRSETQATVELATAQKASETATIRANVAKQEANVLSGHTIAANRAVLNATTANNAAQEAAAIASGKHTAALAAQTLAARALTSVTNGLKTAMSLLGGEIGLIIIAIGAATYAWQKYMDKEEEALSRRNQMDSDSGVSRILKEISEKEKAIKEATQTPEEKRVETKSRYQETLNNALKERLNLQKKLKEEQAKPELGFAMGDLGRDKEKIKDYEHLIWLKDRDIERLPKLIELNDSLDKKTPRFEGSPPKLETDDKLDKELDKIAQYNAAVRKYNEEVEKRNIETRLKFKEEGYNRELELFRNANQEQLAALESAHAQELVGDRQFATQKLELSISSAEKELETLKKKHSDIKGELNTYQKEVDEINRTSAVGRTKEEENGEKERRNVVIKEYNRLLLENQKLETDESTASSKLRVLQQELSDLPVINAHLDAKLIKELEIKRLEAERLPLLAQMKENEIVYQEMSQKNLDITIINLQKEIDLTKQLKELQDETTSQKDKVDGLKIANIRDPYSREIAQIKNRYEIEIREINKRDAILKKSYESMPKASLAAAEVQKQIDLNQQERVERAITLDNEMSDLRMKATSDYIGYAGQGFQLLADIQDQSSRSGFEAAKNYNAAAVIMNTAAAVMAQLSGPDGWSPSAWARAALAAATGAIQYAKVMSTSYGGGGSTSSGVPTGSFGGSSTGTSIGRPDTTIRDSVGEEALRNAAMSMENASLAMTKVADGLTKISDVFKEGSLLSMAVNGTPYKDLSVSEFKNTSVLGDIMTLGKDSLRFYISPLKAISSIYNTIKTGIFGGSWQTKSAGVEFGLNSGEFTGRSYIYQKKDGGWFSSDKKRTRYSELDADFAGAMDVVTEQIKSSILRAAIAMGTTVNFNQAKLGGTKIQTSGRTNEQIQKDIEAWMEKAADALAKTMQGLEQFSFYGENAFDAAMRLATALQSVNENMELIGRTQFDSTLEAANMAYKLQDLMGGADSASDKIESYFEDMFTEQEQNALKQTQIARQMSVAFGEMGLSVPETKSEFIALVDSLDLTTERGRALFASLMDVSSSFAELKDLEVERLEAVKEATEDLLVRYLRALNQNGIADLTETFIEQQKELKEWADKGLDTTQLIRLQSLEWTAALEEVKSGITDTIAEIKGGDLSVLSIEEKYRSLSRQFDAELDPEKLQSLATQFLEASRQYNASSEAYVSDYNQVLEKLESSVVVYDNVQQQLIVMKDLLGVNENVEEILRALLKGLVPESMLSFAVGSSSVPYDMTARIHRDEMIIDPVSSRILRTYGIPVQGSADNNSEELEKMNAELREQNEHLSATVRVLQTGFSKLIQTQEEMASDISEMKTKARMVA